MRSRTAHAVRSGVGESAARESESAKCRHSGKSAWRVPTPQIWPRELRFSGPFLWPNFRQISSRTPAAALARGRGHPRPALPVDPAVVLADCPPRLHLPPVPALLWLIRVRTFFLFAPT